MSRVLVSPRLKEIRTGDAALDANLNEWQREFVANVFERLRYHAQYSPDHEITEAEITAGVTPTNYQYPEGWVPRYGTNASPGTTDMTAAIQAAVDVMAQHGAPGYLPAFIGECRITADIDITASRSGLVGDGKGLSLILAVACNGFSVAAGLSFVTLKGFSVALATRYTTSANTLEGIYCNGTTASAIENSLFEELFIDGFETAIQANGVRNSTFRGIKTPPYGKNGIVAAELTTSNEVTGCDISGGAVASSVALRIGDGTAASEGWYVHDNTFFGFATGLDAYASSNLRIHNNIFDQMTQFGALLRSSVGACTTVTLRDNLFYMTGASADSGIYLANSVAPSAGAARGHTISGNEVAQYPGTTLTNGLLCDGSQESNNRIVNNSFTGDTYDCRITTGTGHIVSDNHWLGAGYSATVKTAYRNNVGTVLSVDVRTGRTERAVVALTYSASMTADASLADTFTITPNNGTAFTINSTSNPTVGQQIRYYIINTTGGALGARTWINHKLVGGSETAPSTGNRRFIDFEYDGTSWYEIGRASGDVPN